MSFDPASIDHDTVLFIYTKNNKTKMSSSSNSATDNICTYPIMTTKQRELFLHDKEISLDQREIELNEREIIILTKENDILRRENAIIIMETNYGVDAENYIAKPEYTYAMSVCDSCSSGTVSLSNSVNNY